MKRAETLFTSIVLLALLLPWSAAIAATDGYYQLSEVTASWDGTDADRTRTPAVDYAYAYGDESSVTYTLPWAFTFYGQSYTGITADTNGNVWFGFSGPVIAALNSDLSSNYYGGVFVQRKSNPERVVIEWQTETFTEEGENLPNRFEVVIFKTGTIQTDYRSFGTAGDTDSGSGISKGDGTYSLSVTANYGNVFNLANRSFRYTPLLKIAVDPEQGHAFGNGYIGTNSASYAYTVTNHGAANLTMGTVSLTGSNPDQFAIIDNACTAGSNLPPDSSCLIRVAFAPQSPGAKSAVLHISSNDPVTPNIDMPLTGIGVWATLSTGITGAGAGTVTISPLGLSCTTSCSTTLSGGQTITFSALHAEGSYFAGWSGACSGTGVCTIAITGDTSVTANFKIFVPFEAEATPPQIDAEYQGNVTLVIVNRIANGAEHLVEQIIDIDGDGTRDPSDTSVIRSFKITDGVSSMIPSVPGDEDGIADGSITTRLQHLFLNDIHHAPGKYIMRVSSGDAKAEVPFTVNPVSHSQSISGVVTDGTNPVPGAIVRLVDQWQRDVAFAIANSNGQYLFNVKDHGIYAVIPSAYGFASVNAGYQPFTLAAGQNITDRNLTLTTGTYHVSGMVRDAANGAGIAGIWVKADSTVHSGIAMTDRNGNYDILLPSGQYDIAIDTAMSPPNPFLQGYTGFDRNSVRVDLTTNVAAVDFALPKASVFISGKVTDEIGLGISGIPIQGKVPSVTDAREPVGTGLSNAGGDYMLGIYSADNWTLFVNNAAAGLSGYIGPLKPNFSTLTSPLTNNDFILRRITSWIQGTVKDSNNNLLGNIEVTVRNPDSSVVSSITTDSNGFYRLGVYEGGWHVDALAEKKGYGNLPEQGVTLANGETQTVDFVVDVTPPIGTLTINSASPHTASPDVTLNLACNDNTLCTTMQFSNDNNTWTPLEPFATTRQWSLSAGDGAKSVHVRFTDAAGNSATANATILHDTTPPATVASLPGGSYNTANTVSLTCGDGMGSGCDKIRFTTDGTTPDAASPAYTGPITVSATTLKYYATDLIGNSEPVRTQVYILDTTPPSGGVTIVTAGFGSTTVTLNLACSDPSGCVQMQFSNDGVTWSTPESYQQTRIWETGAADGDRTIYIRLMDSAGNWSTTIARMLTIAWNGAGTGSVLDGELLVAPMNATETFEQHFISRGWLTPQDQVDAGYPRFIQPTTSSGQWEETKDLGSVLPATRITLSIPTDPVMGNVNITPGISVSATGFPGTWTDFPNSYQATATGFRFVRFTLDFAATGGGIVRMPAPLLVLENN